MTFDELVTALEKRGVIPNAIPSLIPLERALKKSGLLSKINPKKTIIIAGTNGKGSTCATLSALLTQAKIRVGLYTSPHLVSLTERFRIEDQDCSESELIEAYLQLLPFIQEENLSHFESLTLMACWIFYSGITRPPVKYTIWEVGMGGLWDACNAIPHLYCAITNLGLDHQFFLGNDLLAIAQQKFGIVPNKGQVVFSPMNECLTSLREEKKKQTESQWHELPPYELKGLDFLKTPWGETKINIWGERAAQNTMLALKLFEVIGFNPKESMVALTKVRWVGRFSQSQWQGIRCPLFLSGDHNVQGIESLLQILKHFTWKKIHIIVGVGVDKDASTILKALCSLPRSQLYLTETPLKPLLLENYPKEFKDNALLQDKSLVKLLEQISTIAKEDDLVLVTGSLYLVGAFLSLKEKSHL